MKKQLRILIAEDNPADVMLVEEALSEHGLTYSLTIFSDGVQAASYLQAARAEGVASCADLILLDLNLPKLHGHEVLRMVRENPVWANVPVIMVTSSDAPKDRKLAAELGANCYFKKPLDLQEFLKLGGLVKQTLQERDGGVSDGL